MDNPYIMANSFSMPNWDSIMADRYFQIAAASPVNFRASQSSQVTSPYAASGVQTGIASNGGIPVTQSIPAESSGGVTLTEAALGTAIIGGGALLLLKKGQFSKLLNAGKSVLGIGKTAEGKISKLTAIYTKDGIRFLQPGKTETHKGEAAIRTFMGKNGIQFTKAEQEYRAGVSALTGFNAEGFEVVVKDGKIEKIFRTGTVDDVLETLQRHDVNPELAKKYKSIQDILAELGKTSDADKEILAKAKNIRFNNTVGDNTLHLSMTEFGKPAELNELTALKRYKFTDEEIQKLKPTGSESAYANEEFWKNRKIGQEFTIGEHFAVIDGHRCRFEGDKLVSVAEGGGNPYEEGTNYFINFFNKNKKAIEERIKEAYEKHKKIEIGTIINV